MDGITIHEQLALELGVSGARVWDMEYDIERSVMVFAMFDWRVTQYHLDCRQRRFYSRIAIVMRHCLCIIWFDASGEACNGEDALWGLDIRK